jgi:hypothetical protein
MPERGAIPEPECGNWPKEWIPMRTSGKPQTESANRARRSWRACPGLRRLPAILLTLAALFAAQAFCPAVPLRAQAASRHAHAAAQSKKSRAAQKKIAVPPTETKPSPAVAAPAPETPNWPANDRPGSATVVWDSHGLHIVAANSSLAQILKEVTTKTGTSLEGMGEDQRVFGSYGPGPARDVLSQLLHGSGYNVLMIGDQGQGTPRRILLSTHTASGSQASPAMNAPSSLNAPPPPDDDAGDDPPEQPEPPQQNRPNDTPQGTPGRPPQQNMPPNPQQPNQPN